MQTADLLARARAATTRDEECAAIRAVVCHFITDAAQRLPLTDIIVSARSGRAPSAVLLGVVAALVPEGWGMRVDGPVTGSGRKYWEAECGPSAEEVGPTPALALLIALLESDNAEA